MESVKPPPPKCLSLQSLRMLRKFITIMYCQAVEARLEEVKVWKSLEFWQVQLHFDLLIETNRSTIKNLWSQLNISGEERRWA